MAQTIASVKLELFVTEALSPQEMLEIEQVLVANKVLLEEYMALRAIHMAGAVTVPKVLDQRVLNLIRSNPIVPKRTETATSVKNRPNILTSIWDTCMEFLSPRQMVMAGGFAAVLVAVLIGSGRIGLYGGPDFHPLIVASLDNPEEILTFRGSSTPKGISTNAKGEITSVVLPITPSLIEGLKKFEGDPSQASAGSLVGMIYGLISKAKDKYPGLSQNQIIRFNVSSINAIQIHPTLWDQIRVNSPDLELIMISLVEQESVRANQNAKASNAETNERVLYFSKGHH